jgi:predicted nucleic acid-binding protein
MPEVIADTSSIQYLHQTDLLDLLPTLYQRILIPQAVVDELTQGRSQGIVFRSFHVLVQGKEKS